MADDELISAYIDGQLNNPDRVAFETQISQSRNLQQQVAVTRLMTAEARQLPAPKLPRHFALPASYARPVQRRWWDGRWLFRAASLVSAGVCAMLLAIDAGQWAGRTPQVPQAVARTMTPILEAYAPTSTRDTALSVATEPMPTLTGLPLPSTLNPQTMSARSVTSQKDALSDHTATPPATVAIVSTPEPATSPLAEAFYTPLPTLEIAVIEPNDGTFSVSLLPRMLAALSGLAAVLFAGLGWLKR